MSSPLPWCTLAALALVGACSVDSGPSTSTGGTTGASVSATSSSTGGGGTCGFAFEDAACDTCATEGCCAEMTACADGAACGTLYDCQQACADVECDLACESATPAAVPANEALIACLEDSCGGGVCIESAYPICDSGITSDVEACAECGTNSCCTDWTACANDATCLSCITTGAGCDATSLDEAAFGCDKSRCGAVCEEEA